MTAHASDDGARPPGDDDVRRVVDDPAPLTVEFQPIVDLPQARVVALEALVRFGPHPVAPPDAWFAAAAASGLGVELERHALVLALSRVQQLPPDTLLSVNLSPHALASPAVLDVLRVVALDRLLVEITEHAPAPSVGELTATLLPLRRRGLTIAMDDVGAGYARLGQMLEMHPDVLKLDRVLASGCSTDPMRQSLVRLFVTLAAEHGMEVIAEGVERVDDLRTLTGLGVRRAQGYLLGPPATQPSARLSTAVRRLLQGLDDAPTRIISLEAHPSDTPRP